MKKSKGKPRSTVVRRSVVLPRKIVEEVEAQAPADLQGNWNRLVRTALEFYVHERKRLAFAGSMARMADDPEIQAVSRRIGDEFAAARERASAEGGGASTGRGASFWVDLWMAAEDWYVERSRPREWADLTLSGTQAPDGS